MRESDTKKPPGFSGYEEKAQEILADLRKTADVVEQASQKARARAGSLRSVWRDLQDLFRLLRAWADRSYAGVSWRTLVMGLGAVLYFLNPLDLAPDFLPFVGYLDDATVIAFVIRSIQQELVRFREWDGRRGRDEGTQTQNAERRTQNSELRTQNSEKDKTQMNAESSR